jgi:hypothetical protein
MQGPDASERQEEEFIKNKFVFQAARQQSESTVYNIP